MRNVESYKPDKKVARKLPRDFSVPQKNTSRFNIKHDPKVVFRAIRYTLTTILLIGAIVFSTYKIIRWQAESDVTNEVISTIQSTTTVREFQTIEVVPLEEERDPYANIKFIDVDLSSLKQTNPDTIGWINIPGTSINYPYVQTNDNEYYLHHSFNKRWTEAGWVFLDYRNQPALSDRNQVIYAHGRLDGSMFGSLQNVLNADWQNNADNHFIKIATETNNTLWAVFSTYRLPTTNDYMTVNFNNDTHFMEFIDMVKNRSTYNFNVDITADDHIITLSTCIGTNERMVIHAKLIKEVQK